MQHADGADPTPADPPQNGDPYTPTVERGSCGYDADTPAAHTADPWAHRRGEPRVFAFVWTIFLFLATATVLFTAMAGQAIAPEVLRPAVRLLLLLAATGICVLWPMTRLSQMPDPDPVVGAMKDFVIVVVPVQALIWPQTMWWLARWPFATVVALAAGIAAWAFLVGGMLALIQAGRSSRLHPLPAAPLRNAGWMCVFVGIAVTGPAVSLALTGGLPGFGTASRPTPTTADITLMLSPLGTVLELTRDVSWSGRATTLTGPHWILIGVVAGLGAAAWVAAAARGRRQQIGLRFPVET